MWRPGGSRVRSAGGRGKVNTYLCVVDQVVVCPWIKFGLPVLGHSVDEHLTERLSNLLW